MAAVRNLAISVLAGRTGHAAALRFHSRDPSPTLGDPRIRLGSNGHHARTPEPCRRLAQRPAATRECSETRSRQLAHVVSAVLIYLDQS